MRSPRFSPLLETQDEVLVRIESPGGMVHGYGLAASQLERVRQNKIRLVTAVDKVAASGGYLMASVSDHIIAAPFALVGSIGVVAQVPNVHRLLKKHDVDVEVLTAGKYKRTLTIFGENTEQGRAEVRRRTRRRARAVSGVRSEPTDRRCRWTRSRPARRGTVGARSSIG